jgi:hypothetical protein
MPIDDIRDASLLGPDGTPTELNISVIPSGPASISEAAFSTQYSFSSSTTSFGVSTKETAEAKVCYGVPDVDSVSVDIKTSAEQSHQTKVSNTYDTYSGRADSLSATTGLADHLFYTISNFTIYYYPVIGQ